MTFPPFLVVALSKHAKTAALTIIGLLPPSNLAPVNISFPKLNSFSAGGSCTYKLELTPINYAKKFSRSGVHLHPLHPLATPMLLQYHCVREIKHKIVLLCRLFTGNAPPTPIEMPLSVTCNPMTLIYKPDLKILYTENKLSKLRLLKVKTLQMRTDTHTQTSIDSGERTHYHAACTGVNNPHRI